MNVLHAFCIDSFEIGLVDKYSDPRPEGCDKDKAEEAVGGLVASGGQSSAALARRCRTSHQPASASAVPSRLPAPTAAWPPTRQARRAGSSPWKLSPS